MKRYFVLVEKQLKGLGGTQITNTQHSAKSMKEE